MSSRAIVSLGVWILAMVLLGTMTVGLALFFYVALTAFFAVVVGVMMLITRRREQGKQEIFSATIPTAGERAEPPRAGSYSRAMSPRTSCEKPKPSMVSTTRA